MDRAINLHSTPGVHYPHPLASWWPTSTPQLATKHHLKLVLYCTTLPHLPGLRTIPCSSNIYYFLSPVRAPRMVPVSDDQAAKVHLQRPLPFADHGRDSKELHLPLHIMKSPRTTKKHSRIVFFNLEDNLLKCNLFVESRFMCRVHVMTSVLFSKLLGFLHNFINHAPDT